MTGVFLFKTTQLKLGPAGHGDIVPLHLPVRQWVTWLHSSKLYILMIRLMEKMYEGNL